jgi:uncharacterized protein involved in exopolysaccharide biosynthesis
MTTSEKLADASQRQADLSARYNSRHPAVVTVEAEKRDIERSLSAETQRMVETVRNDYALAKARETATEQAMREATGQGGLDSDGAIRLRELERNAAVNKSLFDDFLQKAKVTEVEVEPGDLEGAFTTADIASSASNVSSTRSRSRDVSLPTRA